MRTLQIATILLTFVLLSGTAVAVDWTMFVTDSHASSPTVFDDRIYSTPVTAMQGAFREPQDLRPLPRDYYSPSYRGAPIESTEETAPDSRNNSVIIFFVATILSGILWLLVTSREGKTSSSHVAHMIELTKSATKWNGRFDRRQYATIFVGMSLISIAIGFLLGFAQSVTKSGSLMVVLLAMGLLAWYAIGIVVGVGAAVRRFHDLDLSGWYILLLVIPLVGFLTFLYLVFRPGESGKTRWGGADDVQSTLDEFTAEVTQSKEEGRKAREVTEHGGKENAAQEGAHAAWGGEISQKKIVAVVLVLGVLLVGYWAFAPGSTDAPELIETTTSNVDRAPDIDRVASQTPAPKPVADFTNSIGMEFVLIPAGEFDMGSPYLESGHFSNEGPVHHVKIEKSFYMGRYEVTQREWQEVMGDNPSHFEGDDLPVEKVSWDDVQEFIRKLNENEGTDKYRLPSDAEWEYACRAGATTRYSFGDSESKLGDYAWYDDNSGDKTHPVGKKKPNPYGLYDLHGNVLEWVQDKHHSDYDGAPDDGSAWESGDGADRVFRGGCWYDAGCRSAYHNGVDPGRRYSFLGFRLLKEL